MADGKDATAEPDAPTRHGAGTPPATEDDPAANGEAGVVYAASEPNGALRQTEILSSVVEVRAARYAGSTDVTIDLVTHRLAIIISQDCDLEQDFNERIRLRTCNSEPDDSSGLLVPSILLCEVITEDELRASVPQGRDIWKRIEQNKDERYQFLRAVPPQCDALKQGLGRLGIDFRRHFTVPTANLYGQASVNGIRRCYLTSPYLEHLSSRLGAYLTRVAIPLNHHL